MKNNSIIALALIFILAIACKTDKKETDANAESNVEYQESNDAKDSSADTDKKVQVMLSAKSGSNVTGNAIFKQKGTLVSMTAIITGLDEGVHAIHLHAESDCSSDDGKSTGGHWNPTAQPHGEWGTEAGYHKGDIGNFTANANGQGTITFVTDQWCIGCGDETKDILGKGIIVHQGTDDFISQPSGAAGSRVSCGGVIE
mgnify:CR=1 FL=1